MPLATRPNQKYEIVLSTDLYRPENKRPVFIFRQLNTIDWQKIAAMNDEFEKIGDSKEMLALAFKVIRATLCGWRNMIKPDGKTIPYSPGKLNSMVTLNEAVELMEAAVSQAPNFDDKKKFDLQSGSNTEKSVKTATE